MSKKCVCTLDFDIRCRCMPNFHQPSKCPVIAYTVFWLLNNDCIFEDMEIDEMVEYATDMYSFTDEQASQFKELVIEEHELEQEFLSGCQDFTDQCGLN